jgi:hydroxypyruvate isomerase
MDKKEGLARRLLDYLEKNPDAGDTLEGIANWWLEQQRVEQVVDDVAEALDYLVKIGVVQVHKLHGGVPIYKVKE